MIISPQTLLRDAKEKRYAVPAFNFYNLDILFAALEAAEEENAPVILEIYHVYYPFLHKKVIADAVLEALRSASVHCYLHLDHATDPAVILDAMDAGFQSVMIDASLKSLEENIAMTKSVVAEAKRRGVFTEAEIGHVPPAAEISDPCRLRLAEADECRRLVQETQVDSLAAAVGTAHGVYRMAPKIDFQRIRGIAGVVNVPLKLDFDRIDVISKKVNIPLVLHGGSGTPDEAIRTAVSCGITKVNVGTELKHAWSKAMRAGLDAGELEPRILSAGAREAVKEVARQKIRLLGAAGRNAALTTL